MKLVVLFIIHNSLFFTLPIFFNASLSSPLLSSPLFSSTQPDLELSQRDLVLSSANRRILGHRPLPVFYPLSGSSSFLQSWPLDRTREVRSNPCISIFFGYVFTKEHQHQHQPLYNWKVASQWRPSPYCCYFKLFNCSAEMQRSPLFE